jgi:hypothetical protein
VASLYSLVYVFECKRILFECTSSSSLLMNLMFVIDLALSCISLPPTHPFTTTHCLEFIKTSLVHACLVWFLS